MLKEINQQVRDSVEKKKKKKAPYIQYKKVGSENIMRKGGERERGTKEIFSVGEMYVADIIVTLLPPLEEESHDQILHKRK